MLAVVQFPIADGRTFSEQAASLVARPDWAAPKLPALLAHRDFVRGFGRLVYRRLQANAYWTDEDFFAYARRAVLFPSLSRRHFRTPEGCRWMVSCKFRRLFHDGAASVRVEIGFKVTLDDDCVRKPSVENVVRHLLTLPSVVPGGWQGQGTKDLLLLGPYIADRYLRASTRHGTDPVRALVAAGEPLVVAEASDWESTLPEGALDASAAIRSRQPVHFAMTGTRHGSIRTWYVDAYGGAGRNLRLVLLHHHSQEETLDRMLSWADAGLLSYVPESPSGDRLEAYINEATKILNRDVDSGIECNPLRDAIDLATSTQRYSIQARRRQRLDGMRRQVRLKAERFLAQRDAIRPNFKIYGSAIHVGDQVTFSGGTFYGPVAGTVHAKTMQDSFNAFAAQQPDEQLKKLMEDLHQQVAQLVGRLVESSPAEAADVTGTLASFTEEAGKKEPNRVTLRALGQGLADMAKKVADIAVPVASAVSSILKIFGLPLL